LKGTAPVFFLEMPPYHAPNPRTVLMTMLERAWLFVQKAGTVILSVSIVLWFLSTYPKSPPTMPHAQRMAATYAGRTGLAIEPLIRPLGFDWKIGISLVSSFVAREVFVASYAELHDVKETDNASLMTRLRADSSLSPLVAVCVMIYYVLAMQCLSTIAVVKRETNGWTWPLFMTGYMTALAWVVTFIVYQVGTAFGWGVR